MKTKNLINLEVFNGLYYLFIKTLVGKLLKKGKKNKALKFYKLLKEQIKLNIRKKKKEVSFVFLLSMLNSMPRVSFKEIRLGSQKKDVPMPINEKKQVLVCVDTLLKASKNKKKVELNKLTDYIISSCYNKGIIIRNKKLKYRKAIINKMLLNMFMPKKKK
jgi:ribosomal protein S7